MSRGFRAVLALALLLQAAMLFMELRPRPRALWGDEIMYADLAARCDKVVVAGLSMGGSLTVWLATRHPEIADRLRKIREAAPGLYGSVYENPMLGAEQKAVPHPEQYGEPLSTDIHVLDSGEVLFRDKSGQLVPANNAEHVMLTRPDGSSDSL